MSDYEAVRTQYTKSGFGGRVGFGGAPAIIAIDLAHWWLNPESPIGSEQDSVVENTCAVLRHARNVNVPIFFTTMGFDQEGREVRGPITAKKPHYGHPLFVRGSRWMELDPRLERRPEEILLNKPRASAFWQTPLLSHLTAAGVDTVIITGVSTSGCIRATAESGFNHQFHTIVVEEAVGDRSPLAHEYNLTDIDLRFADVTPMKAVCNYLASIGERPNG